jgi:hypothetical protein
MSSNERSAAPVVSREYRVAPDYCARALELLLEASFSSQASKGGPYELTSRSMKECTTSQDKKGKENADLHGD